MMRTLQLLTILLILGLAMAANAQTTDEGSYGPGISQDADGDGIPNCDDPDYVPPLPLDGTGNKYGYPMMVDFTLFFDYTEGCQGYGLGDGTGTGEGPEDGTGFGPGDCTCE